MSSSYTVTESATFTVTHAKYLASKVAADLKRMQRLYGKPSDSSIEDYEVEITQFLKNGFLKKVSYGFQRDGNWIEPTLIYTARELNESDNDDPGKIKPGKDIEGAFFGSFLEYSDAWYSLSESERDAFKKNLPLKRTTSNTPGIDGYLDNDRNYSSGGKSLSRTSVRSYG